MKNKQTGTLLFQERRQKKNMSSRTVDSVVTKLKELIIVAFRE